MLFCYAYSMKIILIVLAVLVVYIIGTFIRIRYTLSSAKLPSIVQEDKTFASDDENGNTQAIRYIAAGDSTAFGVGASAVDKTYSYRIAEALSDDSKVEYRNVAKSGAKTQDVIDGQLKEIIDYNPDIVTVSIGANDVNHLNNQNQTYTNIRFIAEELEKKTRAEIYLTDIPILDKAPLLPYFYRKYLSYQTKKLNKKILALDNGRIHIVDIYSFGWDKYPDVGTTFAKDGFHPNDEGYANWTNAFLSKMPKK